MTLLDAKQYDPTRDRRRLVIIIGSALVILILAGLTWLFRYWPEERVADKFFSALQKQDYETAYGIWMHARARPRKRTSAQPLARSHAVLQL